MRRTMHTCVLAVGFLSIAVLKILQRYAPFLYLDGFCLASMMTVDLSCFQPEVFKHPGFGTGTVPTDAVVGPKFVGIPLFFM